MPFAHVTLHVSDIPTSTSFYLSCFQPLGWRFVGTDYERECIGFGQKSGGPVDVWIVEKRPGAISSPVHIIFPAPSIGAVDSFFSAALKAGALIRKEPFTRDQRNMYHCASIIDFDGNTIEAVYRNDRPMPPDDAGLPVIALQDNKSTKSKSAAGSVKGSKAGSVAPPKSEASQKSAPKEEEEDTASKKSDGEKTTTRPFVDEKAANTIAGTLIGAAASAAIAWGLLKTRRDSVYRS